MKRNMLIILLTVSLLGVFAEPSHESSIYPNDSFPFPGVNYRTGGPDRDGANLILAESATLDIARNILGANGLDGPKSNGYSNIALDAGSVNIAASAVPKPVTVVLLGTVLIGLARWSRKKFIK